MKSLVTADHLVIGSSANLINAKIMKKLFYIISLAAFMASVASCMEMDLDSNPAANGPSDTQVNQNDETAEGTTTLTICARVPQTKTYLTDTTVNWSKGDVITVVAPDIAVRSDTTSEGLKVKEEFTISEWPAGVTPIYALFTGPGDGTYEQYAPVMHEDGTVDVTLRAKQELFNTNSFGKKVNISIGELVEEDGIYSTTLRNLCGLIKFSLAEAADSVLIEDLGEAAMTGKVSIRMENGLPVVDQVIKGTSSVKITSRRDNNILKKNGTFYACVLPGTYTPKVTVYSGEESYSYTANSPVEIKRNETKDFGKFAPKVSEPEVPVEPETITITLDFDETNGNQPFTTNLPGSEKVTGADEWVSYTLKGSNYVFSFCAPTTDKGYCRSSFTVNGVTDYSLRIEDAYMQLPDISGFTLTSAEVTGGNTSGNKEYKFYAAVPQSTGKILIGSVSVTKTNAETVTFTETEAGVGYIMMATGSNAQFTKLVLTYTR